MSFIYHYTNDIFRVFTVKKYVLLLIVHGRTDLEDPVRYVHTGSWMIVWQDMLCIMILCSSAVPVGKGLFIRYLTTGKLKYSFTIHRNRNKQILDSTRLSCHTYTQAREKYGYIEFGWPSTKANQTMLRFGKPKSGKANQNRDGQPSSETCSWKLFRIGQTL
jgi:hypothetical protein